MQRGPATPSQRQEILPPVPVGLEHLVALASTSEAFAAALRSDPRSAADAAGIELAPAEQAILGAVDGPSLDAMIARVRPALVEPDRRLFMERAAAAVAILVGGQALGSCADTKSAEGRGEPLPKRRPERPPATAGGARVDRPPEPAPPTGIQPDRPPRRPDPPARPDAGSPTDAPSPSPSASSSPTSPSTRPGQETPCPDSLPRDRPSYVNAKGGVRPR